MLQKYQFEQQKNLGREAKELLEEALGKTAETDTERIRKLEEAIEYCAACERASQTILMILEENTPKLSPKTEPEKEEKTKAKKRAAKKTKEQPKPVTEKPKPVEEQTAVNDDLDDLF